MMKEFFSGLKGGQKSFGETIGIIVNSLLLTMVYVIGIGLTSIIGKIVGKKFLGLKPEKKETYWENLYLGKKKFGEYFRQF